MPLVLQFVVGLVLFLMLAFAINWVYQVIRKPSELFFPVSGALNKTPAETWSTYSTIFKKHSTSVMTPQLLAALAQVEGSGNPVARTYWRWSFKPAPFDLYKPASSAVGMYQFTNGTFDEARRFCIHDHVVVEDGPWNDVHSCWFNSLYTRTIPSNAVEMTSAYLDHAVAGIVTRHAGRAPGLQQKQELATLIHLCGAGAGDLYARRGYRLALGQRCGDHEASMYIAKVNAMKRIFAAMDD